MRDEFKCGNEAPATHEARVSRARVLLALALVVLSACAAGRTTDLLAPAPNLYTFETGMGYPVAGVAPDLRSVTTDILYMTDRNVRPGAEGTVAGYGDRRSDAMAFGASEVVYGGLDDWEALIARTQSAKRGGLVRLRTRSIREIARFPDTPLPYSPGAGRLQATDAARAAYERQAAIMRREIGARMRRSGLDRVMVYVHGFNNEFEDGIGTLANIWHYAGRQSLPVVFSWPAGNDGPLAYFRDIESGEFSVFHVKEFMRLLASVPEVKRIDIVAHSRGTAVMSDAIRELVIEARGGGRDPRRVMKTGILVLAAADLDVGVTRQRLVAERVADAFDQVNIYANPDDGALKLSRLIGSVTRLGGLDPDRLLQRDLSDLQDASNVSIILVEGGGIQLGHAYFRENPAVLSDIVLALRTREMPGTQYRPLEKLRGNIWRLHQNYPDAPLPAELDLPLIDR